ncbi:MAG: histidine kinase [Cruoricaptor ignavus]|nr:histidine kinase [Cruoricaptor ignavus]
MKNKFLCFLLFLLLGSFFPKGQEHTFLDSLNNSLTNAKTNREKALLLMKISDYWSYRDTVKAFDELRKAEQYIGQDQVLKGIHTFYKAGVYYDKDIEKSQTHYMEAENILQNTNSAEAYEYRAKAWHNFAALEQIKGNQKKFLDITLQQCIPLSEKSGNKGLIAGYNTDVGMVFHNLKEYDKAEIYFKKALKILDTTKNQNESIAWTQLNLANTYHENQKYELEIAAISEAENALKNLPQSQYNSLVFLQKSRYYSANNKSTLALQNIQKGIDFSKKMNLDYDYLTLTFEKFRFLKEKKDYNNARAVLLEILGNKKFSGNKKNQLVFLAEIADLEKQAQNYEKAYHYSLAYQTLNDSLNKENEKIQILNLESKYKSKEQEESIKYLETKNQQQYIIFGISAILFFSIVSFLIYIFYQRKQQNEERLKHLEQKKDLEINQALTDGENKERERIAKELHDGLGGRMTGIKIGLEQIAEETQNPKLADSVKQLDQCLTELRTTSKNLIPETLYRFGLEEALKDFFQNMKNERLNISYYLKNLNQIDDKKKQLNLYRIVQEAVGNAMKHANATEILVQCTLENNLLLIDVEDNGVGFDLETEKRNLGLSNIEKRTKALNGTLKIETAPNNGTIINIECKI